MLRKCRLEEIPIPLVSGSLDSIGETAEETALEKVKSLKQGRKRGKEEMEKDEENEKRGKKKTEKFRPFPVKPDYSYLSSDAKKVHYILILE